MGKQSESTKSWNSIYESSATINRMTGFVAASPCRVRVQQRATCIHAIVALLCELRIQPSLLSPGLSPTEPAQNPAAEDLVERIKTIHQQLKENLTSAQAKYKEYHDVYVKEAPPFAVGDLVWLSRRNITTTRPSAKLDYKRLGPYKILEVVGESKIAFKLDLPPQCGSVTDAFRF